LRAGSGNDVYLAILPHNIPLSDFLALRPVGIIFPARMPQ